MSKKPFVKKVTALVLALCLTMGLATPMFANTVAAGQARAAVGADCSSAQKDQIYKDFGITRGSVNEITVTNAEERKYLLGLVSESVIGTKAFSSVYIMTTKPGDGLDITLNNITWVSKEIYQNALLTAGITDAKVIITAPFGVSGTAALTGIYKAYEDITGETIPEVAKEVAAEEMVITAELAEQLGDSENISALINELKLRIHDFKKMSDDQVKEEIKKIAVDLNINLNIEQLEKILKLCRSLEKVDLTKIKGRLESLSNSLGSLFAKGENLLEKAETSGFWASVKGFFSGIGSKISDFFSNLFGGSTTDT
jgi:uncharacterized protein YpuA (DUF1002 family)